LQVSTGIVSLEKHLPETPPEFVKIKTSSFVVRPGKVVDLGKSLTEVEPLYPSKSGYKELMGDRVERLRKLQRLLYADNRYSVLFVFQGMDASGKDGAIRHVMSGINPQGTLVTSFKQPSAEEVGHDFMWRTNRRLPERGHIGIFNRSYYEEVLIVRVRPEILKSRPLPAEVVNDKNLWKNRFQSIVEMENHLHRTGTRVVKFFLHISKEEQKRRFLARIDDPDKNWKFDHADVEERRLWDDYQRAYEDCFRATSTAKSPWYIVPADDKRNARLIVSEIVIDTLRALPMSYPEVSDERRKELAEIRKELVDS
jgi:PPK2 family polyphosphate:nucleotide phosphotransferase